MIISRIAIITPICALLVGCATAGPIGTAPSIQVADLTALPAPAAEDYRLLDDVGLIRPFDRLKISVFGFPELGRELQVGASGSFEMPLINTVQASGRAPTDIAQEIETRLRGPFVVNPEVTVDVTETAPRTMTIGGEVRTPGRYPVIGSMSLLEAVAVGGGVSEFADLEDVLILRTVNGQDYIGAYNVKAIQRGNYADPAVFPGDIVMVGDSPARRRLANIMTLVPLITTPLILFDRVVR